MKATTVNDVRDDSLYEFMSDIVPNISDKTRNSRSIISFDRLPTPDSRGRFLLPALYGKVERL